MINFESLPSSVLVKVASLEANCLTLTATLEAARRDLQRLRIELRDLSPRTVADEYAANREAERLIMESERINAAIGAQIEVCERLEKRLRTEERVVKDAKMFLHSLSEGARLRTVDAKPGDLSDIRRRIAATQDEIGDLSRIPVPSPDLSTRIRSYVDGLRSQPLVRGISAGQALSVHYPLRADADPVTMSGFSGFEANALLVAAFLDPERLSKRLTQAALAGSIDGVERDNRLHALQEQLVGLRYSEEHAVSEAIKAGEDVSRSSSAPAWSVLLVAVEHEQQAAA